MLELLEEVWNVSMERRLKTVEHSKTTSLGMYSYGT